MFSILHMMRIGQYHEEMEKMGEEGKETRVKKKKTLRRGFWVLGVPLYIITLSILWYMFVCVCVVSELC